MVEIYNEKVQDLLVSSKNRPQGGLKIREEKKRGVYIQGVTEIPVGSYEEIDKVMQKGNENRSVGAHKLNQNSSRAHTVISIDFKTIDASTKTERLSVINLVDLAGSEKTEKAGTTGDRLKEGCAINKSLSWLGQVIKVLADKSSGKGKKQVVPYRNSALTRILQNALGGNSKTMMICALSPAGDNYEETLSTLRYADRAKSIKNKAVVNESPTEKLIRELKEENERLKKLAGGGGVMPGEDSEEYKKMLEQNERDMEEREKSWQERLEEAQATAVSEEKKSSLNVPHIANLSEDPQLDRLAVYDVSTDNKTYVGRKKGKPAPNITLGGPGIQTNHAYFESKGDDVYVKANSKDAKDQIKVNGKLVGKGIKLEHNDRIVFGAASMFVFRVPGEEDNLEIDYEMAQDEVNSELKAEQEQKMEEERLDEEAKLKEIEDKYEEERKIAEAKQQAEREEQEQKIKDLEAKLKTDQEEGEKQKAEDQKKQVEEEIRKREEEARLAELRALEDKEEQKKLLEKKKKEHSRLDETLNTLLPMVKEANISAEELKRKITFEPTIVHEADDVPGQSPLEELKNSKSKVKVKITNKEDGYEYLWDPEKFSDRLYMIRDVMNDYFDSGKLPKVVKEEDPFWDPEEAILIGKAYLYLKSLGYLLDNVSPCKIMNTNMSGSWGSLTCGIVPTDETGEAETCPEELEPNEPSDLIGKPIDINIVVNKAEGLPVNLCKDTYVKFNWYLSNDEYQTEIIEGVGKDVAYGFKHHLKIDCVTEDLLKYFEKDAISFSVYGNPTNAKFKKMLTKKESKKPAKAKAVYREEVKEEAKKAEDAKKTAAKTTTKTEKNKNVIQMTTPDGKVVEVVKEKQGCCTIF